MKRILVFTFFIFTMTGIAMISIGFAKSMQPSDKVLAERSQHDISTLLPEQYRIDRFNKTGDWDASVLLLRDWDNKVYVYLLPIRYGKVSLHEFWTTNGYYCTDFRPELNEDRSIKKSGLIKCHDQEKPDWGDYIWQWSYNGLPIGRWGIKMISPRYDGIDDSVIINI